MQRLALVAVLLAAPAITHAQWEGPPTYDYDPRTPGVQAPGSIGPGGAIEGFVQRMVRGYQISFPLAAPLADLQAVLPPGFVALAPPLATTGTITAVFVVGQRTWTAGIGVAPPYDQAFFYVPALNTNLPAPRSEQVVLAIELGTAAAVAQSNLLFGPGISRLGELESEIESEGQATRFKLKVKDEGLGLALSVAATCPGPIDVRWTQDPDLRVFRFVDGREARGAARHAVQGDFRTVPLGDARARYEAAGGYLQFPGGAVQILGLGPGTVTFSRQFEYFRAAVQD